MKIGLALSGGGLRAAVFHFGVLQRLAQVRQLEQVSYLSTVSGASLAIALVYGLNKGIWPDSQTYIDEISPQLRKLLTTINLQHALYTKCMCKLWKVPFARANLLAEVIRDKWGVNFSLKDLPSSPRWLINTTCYETGKNWRFDKKRMGDYQFGYVTNPDFDVANAVAASAALPAIIGPYELETTDYNWVRFPAYDEESFTPIDPILSKVHLWDGGIYENLGLESLYKIDTGPRDGIDYLIVSDAGAPLEIQRNRLNSYLRLINIGMSQSRGLRARAVVNYFRSHPNTGVYLQIGNAVDEIILRSKVKLDFNIDYDSVLSPGQVSFLKHIPTHVKQFTTAEFDQLYRHGYEVADTTSLCYTPDVYSHTPYKQIVKER